MPEPAAALFGFLNVNKPSGVTAHDVVARVRRALRIKQVGHGGTLDPMATGVLPVAIGKATRLLRFIEGPKVYLAGVRFGLTTTTDDIEGDTIAESGKVPPYDAIVNELPQFLGKLSQRPPNYSAVHINGKRAYELARAGAEVTLSEREVEVFQIEPLELKGTDLMARITCGPGTYIRSIARDLGEKLGTCACLSSLVREQSGPFVIDTAHTLDEIIAADPTMIPSLLSDPASVLNLKVIEADEKQAVDILHGRAFDLEFNEALSQENYVMVLHAQKLIAICKQTTDNMKALVRVQPEVVVSQS